MGPMQISEGSAELFALLCEKQNAYLSLLIVDFLQGTVALVSLNFQ